MGKTDQSLTNRHIKLPGPDIYQDIQCFYGLLELTPIILGSLLRLCVSDLRSLSHQSVCGKELMDPIIVL